jgi:hypothetical protein
MEKEPEVGGHGHGRIRSPDAKGIGSTSIRSGKPRLQWSPAMAAAGGLGFSASIWVFSPFPFPFSDFLVQFKGGYKRKRREGEGCVALDLLRDS